MNASLVLGFGNFSKPILKALEPGFPDHDFAVLDEWAIVQEVVIEENAVDTGLGTQVHFVRDLSYFVERPQVALRFDDTKYTDAQTQKLVHAIPEHHDMLKAQVEVALPELIASLKPYHTIVMVGFSGAVLVAEFLLPLVQQLQAETVVTVFTIQPTRFEGAFINKMAADLCRQLEDMDVQQYRFSRQELAQDYRQQTLNVFSDAAAHIQVEALRNILMHKPVTSPYISLHEKRSEG